MAVCKQCGEHLLDKAKFCITCGSANKEVSKEEVADNKKTLDSQELCKNCKSPLREGALFCVSCGVSTGEEKTEDVESIIDHASHHKEESEDNLEKIREEKETGKPESLDKKDDNKEKDGKVDKKDKTATDVIISKSNSEAKKTKEKWSFVTSEKVAKEADEFDILPFGKGVIGNIDFHEPLSSNTVIIKGRVKCLEFNKLSIFSLKAHRGWGSFHQPTSCPCGKDIEIGEYWQDIDNNLYIWAGIKEHTADVAKYPLTIEISKVTEQ